MKVPTTSGRDPIKERQSQDLPRQRELLLTTVIAGAPMVIFAVDLDGRFTLSEGKGLSLLGLRPGQVIGLSAFELYAGVPGVPENLRRALAGETVQFQSQVGQLWFDATYAPLLDAAGHVEGVVGVGFDITDHKRKDEDLLLTRARLDEAAKAAVQHARLFETLAEGAPVGIYRIVGGKCVYANARLCELTGLSAEVLTTGGWKGAVHPDDADRAREAWVLGMRTGQPFVAEYRFLRPDGTVVWVMSEARQDSSVARGGAGYVGTLTEITDRKRTELALARSEERLRVVLLGSRDLPWDLNLETNEIHFLSAWGPLLGYAAGELPSDLDTWDRLRHPEDREGVAQVVRRAFKDGSSRFDVEFRLRHKDGHYVPVLSRGFIGRNAEGKPLRLSGTNQDLSDRKRYEAQLLAARHQLEATLAAVPDLLFEMSLEGRCVAFFPARSELLIAPFADLKGKSVLDALPPEAAAICLSALREAQEKGTSFGKQIALSLPQGRLWFELSVARKGVAAGEEPRLVMLSRDITARKREQDDLARASAEKDVLLAELHHRVKNSLQLVVSLLELQISGAAEGDRESLKISRDRAVAISSVYNGLLDGLPHAEMNLVNYLDQIAQRLRMNYQVANRDVAVSVVGKDGPVLIDRDRAVSCGLVVTELLTNALKYAFADRPMGTIAVTVFRERESMVISVADDGIGMPAAPDGAAPGGLGTRIVLALVGQLSGHLTMESGLGTRLTFTFPVNRERPI